MRASVLLGQLQTTWAMARSRKRIAIIGLPFMNRSANPLIETLARCIHEHEDWQVVFSSEAFVDAFTLLPKIECDGVLARVVSEEIAAAARDLPFPVVNVSSLLEHPGVPTVRHDSRGIGRLCAGHLLEKRFTRFGIVEIPYRDWCFTEIQRGFIEAVREALPSAGISMHRLDSLTPGATELSKFQGWLGTLKSPAAIFMSDDGAAPALMETCKAGGFQIPGDFAFLGGCGHPDVLPHCHPTITHPVEDGEWLIRPACEYLAELMSRRRRATEPINLPCPGLVIGGSTDITVVEDLLVRKAVDFVDAHFHKEINVGDVVSHVDRSRRLLEMRFADHLHVSIHQYILDRRVRHAVEIMTEAPRSKMSRVAEACGFSNRRMMARAFKAATGQSPAEWIEARTGS